jgi:hypothetical protein
MIHKKWSLLRILTIFALIAYLITCIPHAEAALSDYQLMIISNTVIRSGIGLAADELIPSKDEDLKDQINQILSAYKFTKSWIADEFDCTEMSRITCDILQNHGLDARLLTCIKDDQPYGHQWVVVFTDGPNSPVVAIECCNTPNHIGEIVSPALTRKWHSEANWTMQDYYQGYLCNSSQEITESIGLSNLEWNVKLND